MASGVSSLRKEAPPANNDNERASSDAGLIDAMMRAEFYPHPCDGLELRQTLTSWLMFAGEFVYKVKKPVRLPFVDALTPAARYLLCQAEAMLNQRLAPELYFGVKAIAETRGRYSLLAENSRARKVREFAVMMRRLPEERMLERMAADGSAGAREMRELAGTLAAFWAAAPIAKSKLWGAAQAISRLVTENLTQAREVVADNLMRDNLALAAAYTRRYLIAHQQTLDNRARDGFVREGHGQLQCDAVFFEPNRITILDCAESDEALRYCDVASELGSLAVDLESAGRGDLAEELQHAYLAQSDDRQFPELFRFYKCYRAVLQGKTETLASLRTELPASQRIAARNRARRLFALAVDYARM
jgi:aminoglycoside phosphotransferase family enzyme